VVALTVVSAVGFGFAAGPARPVTPSPHRSFAAVEATVRRGIRRGIYPGAVVVIGRHDTVLYARGFGHLTWSARSPAPRPDSTLWDLASLTKVVGTTSAVMRLVDAGRIDLDAPVATYLPRFTGGGREAVTVRMLLDHTSGLRSYLPLYRLATTRDQAIDLIYSEPLSRAPGATAEYSDLNALLLGFVIEAVTHEPLDQVVRREVLDPLHLASTTYHPPSAWLRRTAPSALDRGRTPRRGAVNDLNAALFGGVAGHAGLFSTGRDLARYAQVWLRRGRTRDGRWVSDSTLDRFLVRGPNSGTRLLGWDTPDTASDEPSVFGRLASESAYGHTGWTGTELWVDPANDLFLVFLTNRSFDPRTRHNSIRELRVVRADLSDAVLKLVPRTCLAQPVPIARC
jgi:CubicO group peptidase (beta-lactamase class C family)